MTERESWDSYFLRIAKEVASRATCNRKKVGCVLVVDNHIVSTGYNGSLPGKPHCTDVGCELVHGRCSRTIHAEANALLHARAQVQGATAYTTLEPCPSCTKLLRTAGVERFIWPEGESYEGHDQRGT